MLDLYREIVDLIVGFELPDFGHVASVEFGDICVAFEQGEFGH